MTDHVLEIVSLTTLHQLIEQWSSHIEVTVSRVQIRQMRTKWGSISTAGNLTLSSDLLRLQVELVEYVVVHELVHLRCPHHSKAWKVSMGLYLPDWRMRHQLLAKQIRPL